MGDIYDVGDGKAFAQPSDVAARMGVTFTSTQATQCDALLPQVALAIAAELDQDDAWLEDLTEAPTALFVTSVEAVTRVMQNPRGARSSSRTLGSFSETNSFADAAATLELTDREVLLCRRAVLGDTGSSRPDTIINELIDCS